jgi:uncharacterized protein
MKLKWSLAELHKNQSGFFMVNGRADLTNSLKNRKQDLMDASLVDVQGTISMEGKKRYFVDLTLNVELTLPSTRSLQPVALDMTVPFHEVYLAPDALEIDAEDLEDDIVFTLENDILDLKKPIEDTILASIPMKVLSEEEKSAQDLPKGQDWELQLEDEAGSQTSDQESTSSEASPFDVLKDLDLFDDKGEE